MDTKYLKRVAIYFVSAIAAVALILYIWYHLADGFTTDITTMYAEPSSERTVITSDGYIFRNEEYVFSSYSASNAVNYLVSDGEKVGIDRPIAESYSDASGYGIRAELDSIEEKLKILDESSLGQNASVSDTEATDKKISTYYRAILENLAEGKYSHAMRSSSGLLIQLNRRQLITGEVSSFSSLEASLEAKKSSLVSKLSGRSETVLAEKSGYFYIGTDGYENIFSSDKINTLTLSSFKSLTESEPETFDGKTPIGRIVLDYKWYIAVPMTKSAASGIKTGRDYEAVFPYNYDMKLTLKAEKVLTDVTGDDAAVIFSSGEMPEDFGYRRMQSVEIITSEVTGYRIPSTAVRVKDGVYGVYTLYGGKVIFKRAEILGETDGYYIVSITEPVRETESVESDSEETIPDDTAEKTPTYPYLSLHDKIIISGKELSDGMVFY